MSRPNAIVSSDGSTRVIARSDQRLSVTGNVNLNGFGFSNVQFVSSPQGQVLSLGGNVYLNGTLSVTGGLNADGPVLFSGPITFTGPVSFSGPVTLTAILQALGGLVVQTSLSIQTPADFNDNPLLNIGSLSGMGGILPVLGELTVGGLTSLSGGLEMNGGNITGLGSLTPLAGPLVIQGGLDVTGATTLQGPITLEGLVTFGSSPVDFGGAALGDVLSIAPPGALLTLEGNVAVANSLTVTGGTTLNGATALNGLVTFGSSPVDFGGAALDNVLSIAPSGALLTLEGNVAVANGLTVTGGTALNGAITLNGLVTFSSSPVDFGAGALANIGSLASHAGPLVVLSGIHAGGVLDMASFGIINVPTVTPSAGTLTLNGTADVNVDLLVAGNTNLTGSLSVTGATVLNGAITLSGPITFTSSPINFGGAALTAVASITPSGVTLNILGPLNMNNNGITGLASLAGSGASPIAVSSNVNFSGNTLSGIGAVTGGLSVMGPTSITATTIDLTASSAINLHGSSLTNVAALGPVGAGPINIVGDVDMNTFSLNNVHAITSAGSGLSPINITGVSVNINGGLRIVSGGLVVGGGVLADLDMNGHNILNIGSLNAAGVIIVNCSQLNVTGVIQADTGILTDGNINFAAGFGLVHPTFISTPLLGTLAVTGDTLVLSTTSTAITGTNLDITASAGVNLHGSALTNVGPLDMNNNGITGIASLAGSGASPITVTSAAHLTSGLVVTGPTAVTATTIDLTASAGINLHASALTNVLSLAPVGAGSILINSNVDLNNHTLNNVQAVNGVAGNQLVLSGAPVVVNGGLSSNGGGLSVTGNTTLSGGTISLSNSPVINVLSFTPTAAGRINFLGDTDFNGNNLFGIGSLIASGAAITVDSDVDMAGDSLLNVNEINHVAFIITPTLDPLVITGGDLQITTATTTLSHFTLQNGSQQLGYILQSAADGTATWVSPTAVTRNVGCLASTTPKVLNFVATNTPLEISTGVLAAVNVGFDSPALGRLRCILPVGQTVTVVVTMSFSYTSLSVGTLNLHFEPRKNGVLGSVAGVASISTAVGPLTSTLSGTVTFTAQLTNNDYVSLFCEDTSLVSIVTVDSLNISIA